MNESCVSAMCSADEMMVVTAASFLDRDDVTFVGIGLPSEAANLARLTHAPNINLIYESGTIGTKPKILPLSIGDSELFEHALCTVSVPEMFRYWLQGGRIKTGFLGAAQIDRFGNINTTVIGDYHDPKVRLPGSGGASDIAAHCHRIYILLRHRPQSFVKKLDFVTSIGFGEGGDHRKRLGLQGQGPVKVITDLGVLQPTGESNELTLVSIHPGIEVAHVKASTSWPLKIAENLTTTQLPSMHDLTVLRNLKLATAKSQR
jgi:glutaconate CoA-transferase subunit B